MMNSAPDVDYDVPFIRDRTLKIIIIACLLLFRVYCRSNLNLVKLCFFFFNPSYRCNRVYAPLRISVIHTVHFDNLILSQSVAKILTWRWKECSETPSEEPSTSKAAPKQRKMREFFVKWADMSYWHCDWITELQLDVFHPLMYR